jgi:hypothetical protein
LHGAKRSRYGGQANVLNVLLCVRMGAYRERERERERERARGGEREGARARARAGEESEGASYDAMTQVAWRGPKRRCVLG